MLVAWGLRPWRAGARGAGSLGTFIRTDGWTDVGPDGRTDGRMNTRTDGFFPVFYRISLTKRASESLAINDGSLLEDIEGLPDRNR